LLPEYSISIFGKNSNKQNDTLCIFLDLNCDTWYFSYQNELKFEDNDSARISIINWLKSVFPENKLKPHSSMNSTNSFTLHNEFGLTVSETSHENIMISAYLLDPKKSIKDSKNSFDGFLIIDDVVNIKEDDKSTLLKMLAKYDEYEISKYIKSCTFLPDVGYRVLINDSIKADILISFYCDTWMFKNSQKEIQLDCNVQKMELLNLATSVFPDDEYLKRLLKDNTKQ